MFQLPGTLAGSIVPWSTMVSLANQLIDSLTHYYLTHDFWTINSIYVFCWCICEQHWCQWFSQNRLINFFFQNDRFMLTLFAFFLCVFLGHFFEKTHVWPFSSANSETSTNNPRQYYPEKCDDPVAERWADWGVVGLRIEAKKNSHTDGWGRKSTCSTNRSRLKGLRAKRGLGVGFRLFGKIDEQVDWAVDGDLFLFLNFHLIFPL